MKQFILFIIVVIGYTPLLAESDELTIDLLESASSAFWIDNEKSASLVYSKFKTFESLKKTISKVLIDENEVQIQTNFSQIKAVILFSAINSNKVIKLKLTEKHIISGNRAWTMKTSTAQKLFQKSSDRLQKGAGKDVDFPYSVLRNKIIVDL